MSLKNIGKLGKYAKELKGFSHLADAVKSGVDNKGFNVIRDSLVGLNIDEAKKKLNDLKLSPELATELLTAANNGELLVGSTDEISDGIKKMSKESSGISDIFSGLLKTLTKFAPIIAGIAATFAAFEIWDYSQHGFTRAIEDVESASSEYKEAQSNLESLNSELQTTGNRMSELQSLKDAGNISFVEEAELEKLQITNSELERQKDIQEGLLKIKQEASAQAAKNASLAEMSYTEQMEKEHGKKGKFVSMFANVQDLKNYNGFSEEPTTVDNAWKNRDTTVQGQIKENIESLNDYKEQLKDIETQLKDDPSNKSFIEDQENLKEKIQETTSILSEQSNILQGWIDASVDGNGVIVSGYEDVVKSWKDSLIEIQGINLTPAEKQLKQIENFFDGSTGKNFIKDFMIESMDSGKSLAEVLDEVGIQLYDIGADVDNESLTRYFNEITNSANNASNAVSGFDGTFDSVKNAFETVNPGDKYKEMRGFLNQAQELYENGEIGTDDFKATAQLLSFDKIDTTGYTYAADAYKEAWEEKYKLVKGWFDEENPVKSMWNFADALDESEKKVGKNLVDVNKQSGEIVANFSTTAEAAKALGVNVELVDVMLNRLKDYGFEFDDVLFSGEQLDKYKKSLESMKKLYDSMGEGASKDRLGKLIEGWDEQYAGFENDLTTLTEDKVIHIQFEYSLATIQNDIDKALANARAQGGKSSEANATVITGNEDYISTAKKGLGLSKEGIEVPVLYKLNNSKEHLFNQLQGQRVGSEKFFEIQAKITNTQELEKNILNTFSDMHPEINAESSTEAINNAWNDFKSKVSAEDLIANISADDEDVIKKISEITGMSEEEIVILIKAQDDASGVIEEIDKKKLINKRCPIVAEDQFSGMIKVWNEMDAIPKFTALSATDQASWVIKYWNGLTPAEQKAYLKTEMTATDEATPKFTLYDKMVNNLPLNPEAILSATDTATPQVTNLNTALTNINGKVAHTFLFNHIIPMNDGTAQISGTAHVNGTAGLYPIPQLSGRALAMGNLEDDALFNSRWRTKKDEIALTGELGQELVVDPNTNRWWTVGDNGAEFSAIPQGAIVFNRKQTKELLSRGKINSRGTAHASGTAYANGGRLPTPGNNYKYNGVTSNKEDNEKKKQEKETKKAAEKAEKKFEEIIDWIKTLVDVQGKENDRLVKAIDKFEMHANQNRAIDTYVRDSQSYMQTLRNAQNAYMSKANFLDLSEAYKAKIRNGTLNTETITDEDLKKKIDQYRDYYNTAKDLGDQIEDINLKIRETKINKLDNIKDDYDNLVEYANSVSDYNQAISDLYEKQNLVGNESAMMNSLDQQAAIRQALVNEEKELTKQLNALVADGTIGVGTDTWLKWQSQINDVRKEIVEADSAMEDFKQTIMEIRLHDFELSLENLDFTADMASSIRDLMSSEGIYDDDAKFTETGKAQLGLLGTELVSAKQKIANYNVAIEALKKDLENGNITQAQYNKQLQEYQKEQMDAVKATKSAKDAILDLVKQGIEKEAEAMEELISKRKEDLDKQREYYDFQKKMNNQTKEMNKLRAQLSAIEGDDSLEAQAKRRKLQSQLKELQEQYDEDQKDHEKDTINDAYDKALDDINKNKEDSLKDLETNLDAQNKAIADALEIAKDNYSSIYDQLKIYADEYGITLTDSLTSPWKDAMSVIEEYQQAIGKVNGDISIDTSPIVPDAPDSSQTIPTDKEGSVLGNNKTGTWIKEGNKWWYQHGDGSYTKNGFENIDGKWYHFDQSGWMQKGWVKDNNKWYYMDSNGAMKTGWQNLNNKWYYLDGSGAMQTGWAKYNNKWYYMNSSGEMQKGWVKDKNKWYYMDNTGAMKTGWIQWGKDASGNPAWYYLGKNGDMLTSQWIDSTYYVDHTGVMARSGYVKNPKGDEYWWVNGNGKYESKWTTKNPDLKKYKLWYQSGTPKAKDELAFMDDENQKLKLGSEAIITKHGVLGNFGGSTIFSERQTDFLYKMSKYAPYLQEANMKGITPDYTKIAESIHKGGGDTYNVHYDNLVNIQGDVTKEVFPGVKKMCEESFNYTTKNLRKIGRKL